MVPTASTCASTPCGNSTPVGGACSRCQPARLNVALSKSHNCVRGLPSPHEPHFVGSPSGWAGSRTRSACPRRSTPVRRGRHAEARSGSPAWCRCRRSPAMYGCRRRRRTVLPSAVRSHQRGTRRCRRTSARGFHHRDSGRHTASAMPRARACQSTPTSTVPVICSSCSSFGEQSGSAVLEVVITQVAGQPQRLERGCIYRDSPLFPARSGAVVVRPMRQDAGSVLAAAALGRVQGGARSGLGRLPEFDARAARGIGGQRGSEPSARAVRVEQGS